MSTPLLTDSYIEQVMRDKFISGVDMPKVLRVPAAMWECVASLRGAYTRKDSPAIRYESWHGSLVLQLADGDKLEWV